MTDFGLQLDLPMPPLTVSPARPRGWVEKPDVPRMVGGVYWEATMAWVDIEDFAAFLGQLE